MKRRARSNLKLISEQLSYVRRNDMPFDTDKTPKRVIEAARQRNLVPLVGAGISRQAGDAFPNWIELLKFMKERALAGDFITAKEADEMALLLADGKLLMVAE